jgi:8-oxo-dGTP diphosphatase
MPVPEKPSVTADVVIPNKKGEILLIKRGRPPFEGSWALPGGFIECGQETIEECAVREAKEETGLDVKLEVLLGVRSHPKRDPRGHTVTAVYICEVVSDEQAGTAKADDDASDVLWFDPTSENLARETLAFDHDDIIREAISRNLIGRRK